MPGRWWSAVAGLALVVSGCGSAHVSATPRVGECRALTPKAVARPSDLSDDVACRRSHTAVTFAVGRFPASVVRQGYGSRALGRYVYRACQPAYVAYLGGDESIALRSLFGWAWFRPARADWPRRHWYRCDLVGGPDGARAYRPLPRTTKGALAGRPPERWMRCAVGSVNNPPVPCAERHDWRAVTTIKLGEPSDAYPGDRLAQIRSQQYCSDSVGAWLGYPTTDYDYGATVFHEGEWRAGNRRSICWARTTR